MERISEHISYEEAIRSEKAEKLKIDNTPDALSLERMKIVAVACFEQIRAWYGKPIKINSFYRNKAVNTLVKGSITSQHVRGEAIDMDAGSREENKKIFDWAKANLKYDQLIWEYGDSSGPDWVHISFSLGSNRNQTLIIK